MKRTLCIWLPNWPIQRLMAARPELKGQPIVLYATYRGTRRVTACSAQAAALAVAPGMPLAEAAAISTQYSVPGTQPEAEFGSRKSEVGTAECRVQNANCKMQIANCKMKNENPVTSPNSSFIPHPSSFPPHPSSFILHPFPSDPLADREALEELAAWCHRFSPIVGIEDSQAPESLLLDVTGLEHLFGGEEALAKKIVEDFATQRGLTVRVAIADTLGAAWAAAHFGEVQSAKCKMQNANCKMQNAGQAPPPSSFILHPSSFLLVPPAETLPALRPLPIEALRLPAQVVDLLHALGIHRIGQLEPLPRAELAARFGASIALRWDQALGQAPEPVPASPLPAELQARESLEYPLARRDAVELILQQLIGQVAQRLLACGRGAMRLQCRLECSPNASRCESTPPATNHPPPAPSVELSVGLFEPTASAQHLFQLVRLQLERLSIPGPVVGISVEAGATAPLDCRQEGLFADDLVRRRPRLLAGLVDRLANRLGRSAVLRARLVPDAQPELAYQYEPLIGGGKRAGGNCPLSLWERVGVRGRRKMQNANCKLQIANSVTCPPSSFIPHPSSFSNLPPRPLRLLQSPLPLAAMSVMPEGPPLRFCCRGQDHRVARAWGPERIETGWWRGRSIARDYYRIETTAGRRFWLFRRLDNGRWFLHGTFE